MTLPEPRCEPRAKLSFSSTKAIKWWFSQIRWSQFTHLGCYARSPRNSPAFKIDGNSLVGGVALVEESFRGEKPPISGPDIRKRKCREGTLQCTARRDIHGGVDTIGTDDFIEVNPSVQMQVIFGAFEPQVAAGNDVPLAGECLENWRFE